MCLTSIKLSTQKGRKQQPREHLRPKHEEAHAQQPGEDPRDPRGLCDDIVSTVRTREVDGDGGCHDRHVGEHNLGGREGAGQTSRPLLLPNVHPWGTCPWPPPLQVPRAPLRSPGHPDGPPCPLAIPFPPTASLQGSGAFLSEDSWPPLAKGPRKLGSMSGFTLD